MAHAKTPQIHARCCAATHLRTQFNGECGECGECGGAGLKVGLDIRGIFQP